MGMGGPIMYPGMFDDDNDEKDRKKDGFFGDDKFFDDFDLSAKDPNWVLF